MPRLKPILAGLMWALALCLPALPQEAGIHPLPCQSTSNCVNSASEDMGPLVFSGDATRGMALLLATLSTFPEASITGGDGLRLEVIFRTPLGFKDEVIFLIAPKGERIEFRSRSLVGRYDFGKNRSRLVALVLRFETVAR